MAVIALAFAGSASATGTLEWNSDGASFATFGANAAITIDMGTIDYACDSFGVHTADIYVVPSGAASMGSSLHDVNGAPNVIQTAATGGLFIGETIGYTAPTGSIGPGTYAVVYDECQNGKVDPGDLVVDPAFTVNIPTDVPPLPGGLSALKNNAKEQGDKNKDAAKKLAALFAAYEIWNAVSDFIDASTGTLLVNFYINYLCNYVTPAIDGSPVTPWCPTVSLEDRLHLEMATIKLEVDASRHWYGIQADPPDPNYREVPQLGAFDPTVPASGSPADVAVAALQAHQKVATAASEQLLHALERYQGAGLGSDGVAALMQARQIQIYAGVLAAELRASNGPIDDMLSSIESSGRDVATFQAKLSSLQARLASTGVTPEERRQLRNLGLSDADITTATTRVVQADVTAIGSGETLRSSLDALKSQNLSTAATLDALKVDMDAIVGNLAGQGFDVTPTVSAEGPFNGLVGAPISLDSDVAIPTGEALTVAWDLNGDGVFDDATGTAPSYTWTAPYDGPVGVKVTSASGRVAVAYSHATIRATNQLPLFGLTTPHDGALTQLRDGSVATFTADVTDADGDLVSLSWILDGVPAGSGPSFTYTAAGAGPHTLQLTASDGHGTTVGPRWSIFAEAADADNDGYNANADCNDADPAVNPGHREVIGNGIDDDCNPGTPDTGSAPTAAFTTTATPAAVGVPFQFTDASTDPDDDIASRQWSFGDLSPFSNDVNPLHTYSQPGTYSVELTVTDGQGHTSMTTSQVSVDTPPTASFAYGPALLDVVTSATFTDASSDPDPGDSVVSRSWSFGDGTTSTDAAPTHTFILPGLYVVALTVTDSHGLTATASQVVTVSNIPNPPVAGFIYAPTSPAQDEPVQFTDSSTDPGGFIATWAWEFGDGASSAQQNPVHAFNTLGPHTVKLTITDNRGAKSTKTASIAVSSALPTASFTSTSSSNVALAEDGASIVSFSGEYSGGYPASTFIDANPSNSYWASPSGTSTATMVIRLAGARPWLIDKIFLRPNNTCCYGERVRDFAVDASTDGSTFTTVLSATAADNGDLQEFDLPAAVTARYVRYRALNNRGGCCASQQQFQVSTPERGGATTTFTNTSRNATSYAWDFGDGTTSSDATPTHHFSAAGTYHVTLTATRGASTSVASMDYEVTGAIASFTAAPSPAEAGSPVTFTDSSGPSGSVTAWSWSFGDGTSSDAQSPTHVFATPGSYTVTLAVTDSAGRRDTRSQEIVVAAATGTQARFTPISGEGNVGAAGRGAAIDSSSGQYNGSYPPSLMLDSAAGSYYWASPGGLYDAWAKVKLPGAQPTLVDGVAIRPVICCADQRVTSAQIAVSPTTAADGDFTTVLDTAVADNSTFQEFSFPPIPASFVRYTAHNGHRSCCVSTQQLRIYSPQLGGPHVTLHNDSANATSYSWDFGDGSTSTDASPSHTYSARGTYTISLTATGAGGSSTTSMSYTDNGPTAAFTSSPASTAPNAVVSFTDASTPVAGAAITSWSWSFGDGTTSALQNPQHTFTANGTFDVSLRVRDADGWGDIVTKSIAVGTGAPGPAAFFAPYPANGGRNVALYDTGARSTRSSGHYPGCCDENQMLMAVPQNWWATPPGQVSNGFAVVHLAGSLPSGWLINRIEVGSDGICCWDQRVVDYGVDASYIDADSAFVPIAAGRADTNTGAVRSIALDRPMPATFLRYRPIGDVAGYCCISTRQFRAFTGQEGGREVTFKNFTTGASSYTWDFGDPASGGSNTSHAESPTHVFSATGTYHVTLVADDGAGHTDTKSLDQVVLPEPVVTMSGPSVAARGRTLTFLSTVQMPAGVTALSTTWDFGDGSAASYGARGDHAFGSDGTYTVRVQVVDSNGQTTTSSKTVTVAPASPSGSGFTTAASWATGFPSACCSVGPVGMAWDPTGRMIVSDIYTGDLYRFDGAGGVADTAHKLTGSPLPGTLLGLAFDRGGRLYATRNGYGDVVEIDQATWTIKRVVASGIGCAASLATDPLTGDLFVGDCGGILRLTGFSSAPATVSRYASASSIRQFTFAPDGTIFATQWYTNVLRIDGTDSASPGSVSTVFSELREVDGIAIGPGTGLPGAPPVIYVNRNDGQITKLDFGVYPLAATTVFSGGTRGAYASVGPDSCLYATQTTSIVKLTYANGDCTLTQPAEPRLALAAPLSTASQHIGAHAVFVATVSNTATVGGVTVKFEVTGANPATYQATTDATGHASIELVGTHAGTDTVKASATVGTTSFASNEATATWTSGTGAPIATFVPQPVGGGRNVALKEGGATIAAFSSKYDDNHTPEAMIDYSTNEYYESPGGLPWATAYGTGFDTTQYTVVKLPGTFLVDKVYVMPRKCCDGQRVRDFEIAYSTSPTYDPSTFVTVFRGTAENIGRLQEFNLPQPVRATFVRYSPVDNYGDGCCISTMQLQVITGQQGGADVHFADTTLEATSYSWDFGDGGTSTERSPTHHYAAPGVYPVTLTASNPSGSSTMTLQQRVFAPPTASISGPATTYRNAPQTFAAVATGSSGSTIAEYRWDWGDGQVSLGRTVTHQWSADGTYTVRLRVADGNDQSTTASQQVVVAPASATGYTYTKWAVGIPSGCCDIGPMGVAFDPQGRLWVADPYSNGGALYRFGAEGGDAAPAFVGFVGGAPHGVAFGKDGRLYVARRNAGDVVEIDPSSGAVLRVVVSGIACPTGLATDPLSGDLFVTTTGCEPTTIWRIAAPASAAPTKTPYTSNAGSASGIAFAPDGTIYITVGNVLLRVSGTDSPGRGQAEYVTTVSQMDGIAIQPSTLPGEAPVVYLNRSDGLLSRIDLSQLPVAVTQVIRGGTRGMFIAVGPDGCLYATQTTTILRVTQADGSCELPPTSVSAQLTLRPAPSNPAPTTGANERFTASILNATGAGVPVTFTVTGANPGSYVATTDATGSATIEYVGADAGTDTITATASVGGTALTSNRAAVAWTVTAAGPPIALFDPQTRGSGRNVAASEAGATATESDRYDANYTAQSMLDSNVAEYYEPGNGFAWITQYGHVSDPHWAKIVLAPNGSGDGTYMLDRLRIMGRRCCSSQTPHTFEVAVSTTTQDDAAFTTVLHATLDQSDQLQELELPHPVPARYVRYTPIDNYGDGCCIATMAFKAITGQSGGPAVTFHNLSSNATSFEWSFGDGSPVSTEKNPTHTFAGPGTYHVTLRATNANGTTTYSLDQEVIDAPSAGFEWAPEPVKEGVSTTFTSHAAPVTGTTIVRYLWNWGDGTTSTGATATHTFIDNGAYDVTLETLDSRDQKSFTHRQVTVVNQPPKITLGPDWNWRKDRPWRNVNASVTDPGVRDTIVSCTWDFGDGTTSACASGFGSVDHAYTADGTYTVTVTATDNDGGSATETMKVHVIPPKAASGGSGGGGGSGGVNPGTDLTYSTDAQFEKASLLNVNHDAPNSDQLQLNEKAKPLPFVAIPGTNRGTMIRMDINTGRIVGEYWSSPNGRYRNPSRTTIDQRGNTWMTNRDEADWVPSMNRYMGSIERVGVILGGTRVNADGTANASGEYLAPPYEYNTCVDRNGDGLIHTSNGYGNILPWTNEANADNYGGVSTAADECIINYTRTFGTNARTVAIDKNNNLWVGGLGNQWHEELDGVTGRHVPGTEFNLGCGGYGGFIDSHGVLWSARGGSGLMRYDTNTHSGYCIGNGQGDYGLGLDPKTGDVWHTYLGSGSLGEVVKMDKDGNVLGRYPHGFPNAQGVAVDASGNVWVAHSLFGSPNVGHLKTDGTFVGNVSLLGETGPTGVAVDANGKIWTANNNSSSSSRIDPDIGPIVAGSPVGYTDLTVRFDGGCYAANVGCLSGAYPYSYSDMTGFVSIGSTAPQGTWNAIQDGGAAGTTWGTIDWNHEAAGAVPAGASIEVSARAADSVAGLTGDAFVPVTNGTAFSLTGRYLEVQVTLRANSEGQSPVVSDLRVRAAGLNHPPAAADGSVATPRGTGATTHLDATDADGDPLVYTIVAAPRHGTLTGTAPDLTYLPDAGYAGPDSFTFVANDGHGDSNVATISIAVTATPIAVVKADPSPAMVGDQVAFDGSGSYQPDAARKIASYAWDFGDGSPPVQGGPWAAHVSHVFSRDGDYTVRLTVTDDSTPAQTDSTTTLLHVAFLNRQPFADAGGPYVASYTGSSLLLAGSAGDPDISVGDALTTWTWSYGPVTLASGVFVTQPASDVATVPVTASLSAAALGTAGITGPGMYTLTLTVNDAHGSSASAMAQLQFENRAPQVADITVTTPEVTPVALDVVAFDPDGDPLTYTAGVPANGTLSGSAPALTYTPNPGFEGLDTFAITVSDGHASALALVRVTVTHVNRAPVAADETIHVDEDTSAHSFVHASDVDSPTLGYAVVADPTHGRLMLGADGTFTYEPDANYHGPDSFRWRANDGELDSGVATLSIVVDSVNDAPVARSVSLSTPEDTPVGGTLDASDVDGDSLTWAAYSAPAHGGVQVRPDGSFTYAPEANYNGLDSFVAIVSDGQGGTDLATVSVVVTPVNDAPTTSDVSSSGPEDTPQAIHVTASDVDGDVLTYAAGSASHGSVTGGGPDFTYTPAANFNGLDSFDVTVSDGNGGSVVSHVSVVVTPVNDAPTTSDVSSSGPEDTPQAIHVTAADVEGDALSYAASAAVHGTLTGSGADFVYTPAPNYNGMDAFTVTVSDGNGGTAISHVTIDVTPVNDPPVARDTSSSGPEDTPQAIHVAVSDADGDALSFAASTPAHGSLTGSGPDYTYAPAANYNGPDGFDVTVDDHNGGTATAHVSIVVTPVNDPPTTSDVSSTGPEDTPQAIHVAAADVDGDLLAYSAGSASHGTVTGTGPDFSYMPNANYNGPDSFDVTVSDGNGGSVGSHVSIIVTPVNDPPVATSGSIATDEDTAATGALVASDVDGDPLTFAAFSAPANGAVSIRPDGTFTYNPNPNFNGGDSFSWVVSDSHGGFDSGTTSVTVRPVNDPPVARDDTATTNQDTPLTLTALTANDSDVDGDSLRVSAVQAVADTHGTVSVDGAGRVIYVPAAGYAGLARFTYTVSDGHGGEATGSVNVTVVAVGKRPTSVVFTAPLTQPFGPTQLTAQVADLFDPATAQLAGLSVTFQAGGRTFTTTADAGGRAVIAPRPYLLSGPVTISVAENDRYLASTTTVQLTIANAFGNGPGFFTLGDRTPIAGAVSWWTPQWEKANALSGGAPPPSFKGFVNAPALTGCGAGAWTTAPGNSAGPPASVGPYLAVVVASRIAKSGSTITGSVVHILAVRTAPGYGPAPGHDGTGQVVGTVC